MAGVRKTGGDGAAGAAGREGNDQGRADYTMGQMGISLLLMSVGWRGESRNLALRMGHESRTISRERMHKCRSDRENR